MYMCWGVEVALGLSQILEDFVAVPGLVHALEILGAALDLALVLEDFEVEMDWVLELEDFVYVLEGDRGFGICTG